VDQSGSHVKFVKYAEEGMYTTIVPRHREVAVGTLILIRLIDSMNYRWSDKLTTNGESVPPSPFALSLSKGPNTTFFKQSRYKEYSAPIRNKPGWVPRLVAPQLAAVPPRPRWATRWCDCWAWFEGLIADGDT